jgi:hypothetical protein
MFEAYTRSGDLLVVLTTEFVLVRHLKRGQRCLVGDWRKTGGRSQERGKDGSLHGTKSVQSKHEKMDNRKQGGSVRSRFEVGSKPTEARFASMKQKQDLLQ